MTNPSDEKFWMEKRSEVCLDSNEIYLNAGSYSPVPRSVFEAAQRWREKLASSPMRTLVEHAPAGLREARRRLADYLSTVPSRLLLLSNTTHAVNLVVASLDLPAGSEILLTDHEYGAMRYCWERYAKVRGWLVRIVEIPYCSEEPAEIVDAIQSKVSSSTRVLFVSHVTSPTGLVLPVGNLCRFAQDRGIFTVIDGAHAPGMAPVALDGLDADFYAGNCHKWMMAPTGAAFLYVAEHVRRMLQPLVTSWGWEFDPDDDSDSGWGGSRWSQRVEFQGTQDRSAQLVLPEVIDFRQSIGDDLVRVRTRELSAYLRERMDNSDWESGTPLNPQLSGTMTAFEVANVDPIRGREWWWRTARISVPITRAAGRTFVRVSTAWFNTKEEIDQFVEHLPRMATADLSGV